MYVICCMIFLSIYNDDVFVQCHVPLWHDPPPIPRIIFMNDKVQGIV